MARFRAFLGALAFCAIWVSGCLDNTGPRGVSPLGMPGLIVSQPVRATVNAIGSGPGFKAGIAAGGMVYVSMVPGTVPMGLVATIRDQANGLSVTAAVVDGGFDPVGISASVGDTLLVDITRSGSAGPVHAVELVRAKHPPVVVRTNPPSGGRDVPLNAHVVIVFSDPIDPATLTTGSVQLWQDTAPVTGTVRFSDSAGVSAEFRPDGVLAARATYRLIVTRAIVDLGGESLETDVEADFSSGQIGILVDASRDGGVWWYPQAGPFSPGSEHQGKALADHLRLQGYRVDELGRPYAITPQLLQPYAVVIRAGEVGLYTADEISAYRQYVAAGGHLLLLTDHMRNAPPDQVGQSFGIVFAGVTVGPNLLQFRGGHPITNGLSSLSYEVGSALLAAPDSAVILGALDSASYVDLNDNAQQDAGEPSAPTVLGAMAFEAGRIVFCGDVNLWEGATSWALWDNVLAWFGAGNQANTGAAAAGRVTVSRRLGAAAPVVSRRSAMHAREIVPAPGGAR